ncbi:MAG: GAF domain-containing protein [Paracoccaceae bacterium]
MSDLKQARHGFAKAFAHAKTALEAHEALHAYAQALVPVKLYTVMTVDMDAMLAGRAYSNDEVTYPLQGTKPVKMDDWFEIVHGRHESFVSNDLAAVRDLFPDYDTIAGIGCGSIINLPVLGAGQLVATVNMLDIPGYFTPERVALLEAELPMPALATLLAARAYG